MEAVLYAEIYGICMLLDGLMCFWSVRKHERSAADRWLNRLLVWMLLNFTSNFAFTIINRIIPHMGLTLALSYFFKSMYFVSLTVSVFCWIGYAEMIMQSAVLERRKSRDPWILVLGAMCLAIVANLFFHWIFSFDGDMQYRRHVGFPIYLLLLFVLSAIFSVLLLVRAGRESDPSRRGLFRLVSSFPLCLLLALALSQLGESVPVICVCMLMEVVCIFVGNMNHQISTDILTRVNNRQNLDRFVEYKLINHMEQIWLLMIDVDYFKKINDTMGHLEGDRALERVSDVLKIACQNFAPRPFIARYGGDEFTIVMEGQEQNVNQLLILIRRKMEETDLDGKPYKLRVSIGRGKLKAGMTYRDLVEEADEELYRAKQARKEPAAH